MIWKKLYPNLIRKDVITLYDKKNIKQRKYKNYAGAMIDKIIPSFQNEIDKSKDGKITININDVKKQMGCEFVGLDNYIFIKGVKYTLAHNGFNLEDVFFWTEMK
jgi:hypothetical protein